MIKWGAWKGVKYFKAQHRNIGKKLEEKNVYQIGWCSVQNLNIANSRAQLISGDVMLPYLKYDCIGCSPGGKK